MSSKDISDRWAKRFGLAQSPLFEPGEVGIPGSHHVLLDGGYGSFALSESESRIWVEQTSAEWSWSSNVPHHVTVTDDEVAVVRWDRENEELFTRASVERQLDTFYDFLANDRVRSNRRVVEYMVTLFRRVRSLVDDAGVEDVRSVDAYLAILSKAMERSAEPTNANAGLASFRVSQRGKDEILNALPVSGVERVLESIEHPWEGGHPPLKIQPILAVRHAGTEVFQEAHFDLVRSSSPDLFGDVKPAESDRITRGGAHFTPPALARSLVERALQEIDNLSGRSQLAVMDPACGSGAFLHEVLRTLRRTSYQGSVQLVGWDISQAAVSMARFVIENALMAWTPDGGATIDIRRVDSLSTPFPNADVILMNPPFVSWRALTNEQRETMQEILGPAMRGRADLSMAFATKAMQSLAPGGVVGTLLPGSLLTSEAAASWRDELLELGDLAFVASLGDYGLFMHAMVQVGVAVLSKRSGAVGPREMALALVSDNDRQATGNALRELRKTDTEALSVGDRGWRLFPVSVGTLRQRPTWRLLPPSTERILARLMESGRAIRAGSLFDVRQGVLTGLNSAFILGSDELTLLPKGERMWFSPAITNDSIVAGRIEATDFVFYPYGANGLEIRDERELAAKLPRYFNQYLSGHRHRLATRSGFAGDARQDWWSLTRPRSWVVQSAPQIVSKYFGGRGAFAADLEARYVVVQGYAWLGKEGMGDEWLNGVGLGPRDLLNAYVAILNSSLFHRLLGYYAPQVSGGQLNLSPRYVRHVPIPDIGALLLDERTVEAVWRLSKLGNGDRRLDGVLLEAVDEITGRLYGMDDLDEV